MAYLEALRANSNSDDELDAEVRFRSLLGGKRVHEELTRTLGHELDVRDRFANTLYWSGPRSALELEAPTSSAYFHALIASGRPDQASLEIDAVLERADVTNHRSLEEFVHWKMLASVEQGLVGHDSGFERSWLLIAGHPDADHWSIGWLAYKWAKRHLLAGRLESAFTLFRDSATSFLAIRHEALSVWSWSAATIVASYAGWIDRSKLCVSQLDRIDCERFTLNRGTESIARALAGLAAQGGGKTPETAAMLRDAAERSAASGDLSVELSAWVELAALAPHNLDASRLAVLQDKMSGDLHQLTLLWLLGVATNSAGMAHESAVRLRSMRAWMPTVRAMTAEVYLHRRAQDSHSLVVATRELADVVANLDATLAPWLLRNSARHESASLSAREAEVASLLVRGATRSEVANQLFVSQRTVDAHAQSIFRKFGVSSRAELRREFQHWSKLNSEVDEVP